MRRRFVTFAAVLLAMTAMSLPANADIQTYEDDYVSFQYDDEEQGFIDIYISRGTAMYSFSGGETERTLSVLTNPESIARRKEAGDAGKPIDGRRTVYLDVPDDLVAFIVVTGPDNSYSQLLLDTVKIADGCHIDPDLSVNRMFRRHYPYSEQALNYVRKAIEICNEYLEMSIDGKEAANQIETVEKRAKTYSDSTGDAGDEDVSMTLFLSSSDFRLGDDAGVIEMRDELQMILDGAI